jgi:hypothetical protein
MNPNVLRQHIARTAWESKVPSGYLIANVFQVCESKSELRWTSLWGEIVQLLVTRQSILKCRRRKPDEQL